MALIIIPGEQRNTSDRSLGLAVGQLGGKGRHTMLSCIPTTANIQPLWAVSVIGTPIRDINCVIEGTAGTCMRQKGFDTDEHDANQTACTSRESLFSIATAIKRKPAIVRQDLEGLSSLRTRLSLFSIAYSECTQRFHNNVSLLVLCFRG